MPDFTVSSDIDTFMQAANNAAARSSLAVPGTGVANTFTGAQVISANGAASTPPLSLTGTWFTGGSATTTKPQLLIEPTGATSNTWDTAGTGFGVNAPSGFTGEIVSFKLNGAARFSVAYNGLTTMPILQVSNYGIVQNYLYVSGDDIAIANSGSVGNGGGAVFDSAAGPSWTNSGAWYGTQDTFLRRGGAAATLQMGLSSATPVNQSFKGPDGSGTNIVGGKISIGPGQSTGNATPAVLALQGTAAGSSGTTAQTLVDVLSIIRAGVVRITDIPTSSAGLSTGDIWSDGGTLKIV